jgi:hypothetical protein
MNEELQQQKMKSLRQTITNTHDAACRRQSIHEPNHTDNESNNERTIGIDQPRTGAQADEVCDAQQHAARAVLYRPDGTFVAS